VKKAKNFPKNKFKGRCDQCQKLVIAGDGRRMAYQQNDNGTFRYWIRHDDCFFKPPNHTLESKAEEGKHG